MRRVRIAVIGTGTAAEWAILPALSGPDAFAPPDNGAWWVRRPTAHSDISYQPPARPEIVALADEHGDGERVSRIATASRIKAAYADWRIMLRETDAEAVVCAVSPPTIAQIVAHPAARGRWFWMDGVPTTSAREAQKLAKTATGQGIHLWLARPWRLAVAHRTARRLIERHEIGPVSGLNLRWGSSFAGNAGPGSAGPGNAGEGSAAAFRAFSSSYAAIDLLLYFANEQSTDIFAPNRVVAGTSRGTTNVWLNLASGACATALFSAAENWSSTLPRLEIAGTEGRTLLCEGSRRLWVQQPREPAHMLEPPGAAAHISAANMLGLTEDLKAFLGGCVDNRGQDVSTENYFQLANAAGVLTTLQAIDNSLNKQREITLKSPQRDDTEDIPDFLTDDYASHATLPLQL